MLDWQNGQRSPWLALLTAAAAGVVALTWIAQVRPHHPQRATCFIIASPKTKCAGPHMAYPTHSGREAFRQNVLNTAIQHEQG